MIRCVVPAAGKGRRMGAALNKQFLRLRGCPLLSYTLTALAQVDRIQGIYVVAASDEKKLIHNMIEEYRIPKIQGIMNGGETRQESVYNGLVALPADTTMVLVHDGARPFVTGEVVLRVIEATAAFGAAVVGLPVRDTIKQVDQDLLVSSTPERQRLWTVQTPQGFDFDLLVRAHHKAREEGFIGTDDASLVERLGHRVKIVHGTEENLKITTPFDLVLGDLILMERG